jgi:hypothetical protein
MIIAVINIAATAESDRAGADEMAGWMHRKPPSATRLSVLPNRGQLLRLEDPEAAARIELHAGAQRNFAGHLL